MFVRKEFKLRSNQIFSLFVGRPPVVQFNLSMDVLGVLQAFDSMRFNSLIYKAVRPSKNEQSMNIGNRAFVIVFSPFLATTDSSAVGLTGATIIAPGGRAKFVSGNADFQISYTTAGSVTYQISSSDVVYITFAYPSS